ncbi:MAG: glutamine-hydrolyzing carbamoyl-phosphate synthase small subunit, partial [Clostridia bacterium]|nr:glutamine-hydrolyzing carbamoyl-phosphate synthase small subunit [Clostridia bacterium]
IHKVEFEEVSGHWVLIKRGLDIGVLRNVEPPTRPRLECRRETGLILRCDRKVGNPIQTQQGRRPSCPDQEGRQGSEEGVPENLGVPLEGDRDFGYGVDTRQITRSTRDLGSRKVLITGIDTSLEEGLNILKSTDIPKDAVSKVSRKIKGYYPAENQKYHVVAIDCGMKLNILRSLRKRGCSVTVVPWNTSAEDIIKLRPDGVFISNGPGDPTDVPETIETIKTLRGKYPMFGICLGHQIISLSYGAKTYKLKFGHRGGNHPVKNLANGKIEITSQNHSYAVDTESVKGTDLEITHMNLLDDTVEGCECKKDKVFSVQYHPESAPGPQDSAYLFDKFTGLMKEEMENA